MITISGKRWLLYALVTTIFWGVWGAFIEIPEKAGFRATLGYIIWSVTMVPCAIIALANRGWKLDLDLRSITLGALIGFLGAGGQLILFQALREGPAYLVFPFISLFPILTILLAYGFLKEKTGTKQWMGIALALIAIFFLSWQPNSSSGFEGSGWILLSVFVFIMWGAQAFVMKVANQTMEAESIFFYMMVTGILLSPVAYWMTDFSLPINVGLKGAISRLPYPYLECDRCAHTCLRPQVWQSDRCRTIDRALTAHYSCSFSDDLWSDSGSNGHRWISVRDACNLPPI
jgi:uncharacterized membrane protein